MQLSFGAQSIRAARASENARDVPGEDRAEFRGGHLGAQEPLQPGAPGGSTLRSPHVQEHILSRPRAR